MTHGRKLTRLWLAFFMGGLSWSALSAQETPKEKQLWQGTLDAKVVKIQLNFEVTRDEKGNFSGVVISPDQGNAKLNISKMEVTGDDVIIEVASVPPSTFTGKINADKDTISGTWKQGGGAFDFEIKRVQSFTSAKHIESWKGTLVAGAQKFEFQLRIFQAEDGELSAKLDSFSENFVGLPVELTVDEQHLTFEVKISAGKYEGKFSEDKNRLDGHWSQRGQKLPLSFEKIDLKDTRKLGDAKRPQHPKKPYPYLAKEVSFENEPAGITLAGTLTLPNDAEDAPAVILISGSGAQDRDETIFEHKPFLVIADYLTRNGIAVLRYDERGVGKSTGSFSNATSEDFAKDVVAGIQYLKQQPEIDPGQIGLIGHSEGAMIAPMLAAQRDDIAWIVMLAGPGVDGAQIGVSQSRAMAEAAGAPPNIVDAQEKMLKQLFDVLMKSDEPLADEFVDDIMQQFEEGLGEDKPPAEMRDALKQRLEAINNPWFRYFLKYDPRPVLARVSCPVLVLNGKKDLQVLVDLNVDAIEQALRDGGNESFEIHKLDNLNHLFQSTDGPGLVTEYGQIEETFSPVALNIICDWIQQQTRIP